MRYIIATMILAGGVAEAACAASYAPIAPASVLELSMPARSQAAAASESTASAATLAAPPLRCTTPPTTLGTAQFSQVTTDLEGALAAGLPMGSMSASTTKKILIQDWMRTGNCLATDNMTELVYGQGIRLFASSEGLNVEGDVTLGMLAANSTLNNQNSRVLVTIVGFNDPQLTTLGSNIFGRIDVDRFKDIDTLVKQMVQRASSLNNGTIQRLGIVFPPSSSRQHVIASYAVQQVADGQSCDATKARFPEIAPSDAALIAATYDDMKAPCDASKPGEVSRAMAREALGKVRVRM